MIRSLERAPKYWDFEIGKEPQSIEILKVAKSPKFLSKEPHGAREPKVGQPCSKGSLWINEKRHWLPISKFLDVSYLLVFHYVLINFTLNKLWSWKKFSHAKNVQENGGFEGEIWAEFRQVNLDNNLDKFSVIKMKYRYKIC